MFRLVLRAGAGPLLLLLAVCACAAPGGTPVPVASSAPSPSPSPSTSPSPAPAADWWRPAPGAAFQVNFAWPIDLTVEADVYELDLFDNGADIVGELHARGRKVLCYLSAGSWEDWRPDAGKFPPEVIGNDYEGWPGEKWLDVRRIDLLAPIMRARLDRCAANGFDGVDPDNLEVVGNVTGFPITYQDQLEYALWLAAEAHARGLAVGLKNAPGMVAEALPHFDFAVAEDCFHYGWCELLEPFIQDGKPVFAIEYTDTGVHFGFACRQAQELGLTMILKKRNLDSYFFACGE